MSYKLLNQFTQNLTLILSLALLILYSPFIAAQNMPEIVSLAKEKEWYQLSELIEDGLDPNVTYGDGSTALLWASYHDNLTAMRELLSAGADVNSSNDLGVTALWLAAQNRNAEIATLLLETGADPSIRLLSGESILMTAAQSGNGDVVRVLLEAGADPNISATRNQTALMWAANEGHHEVVAALVDHGADVHARSLIRRQYVKSEKAQDSNDAYIYWTNEGGNTALIFAARAGDPNSARYLIEGGADVNEVNAFGTSPLITAVHAGNIELISYLISSGADINDSQTGHTALHAAVLRGNLEAVTTLISAGANLEALVEKPTPVRRQTTDYHFHNALVGSSPLWLAARFSEPELMSVLIDAGADVNTANMVSYPAQRMGNNFIIHEGEISLVMAAVGMGHRRLRNSWWTPERRAGRLETTSEEFILDSVMIAIQSGADPNKVNLEGETALSFAHARRYESVVTYLETLGGQMTTP